MSSEWSEAEKKKYKYKYLKYLKTCRKRIVELSNAKVYIIIKELVKKLPVEDMMCVTGLVEISKLYVSNPDAFNRQLQHVFDLLEFSEKDSEILRKHLEKAEKERIQREKEDKEFEKNAKKNGRIVLPRIGIN